MTFQPDATIAPIPTEAAGGHRFELPPCLHNASGRLRTVGIEVEFAGLDIVDACDIVLRLYGGWRETSHRFSTHVRDAEFGDWRVEMDAKILTRQKYKEFLRRVGAGPELTTAVEDVLETIGRRFIPSEIVSPPIPITDLARTEDLRTALRDSHAAGTRASLLYLFGFQLNPELPDASADVLVRYTKAFLALEGWLGAVADVDLSRRLSSFVDPFPDEYRALVLDARYAPDVTGFIDDYLRSNPTRNRALDMLPALATIDVRAVREAVEAPDDVRPRPTFHYRLPNCLVDDSTWSFALEWNRWVEVERLAEDPVRLARVADEASRLPLRLEPAEWRARAADWGVFAP